MKTIYVHAKQTSNWGLLIGSLLFISCAFYLFLNSSRINSPETAKIISVLLFLPSVILFIYAIRNLSKKQIVLLIDKKGIVFHPSEPLNYMEWQNIAEIEELKLPRQLIINIRLLDNQLIIEKESNKYLKSRMIFCSKMYNAIISFSANTLDKNHFEIMNIFDEYMDDYKKNNL